MNSTNCFLHHRDAQLDTLAWWVRLKNFRLFFFISPHTLKFFCSYQPFFLQNAEAIETLRMEHENDNRRKLVQVLKSILEYFMSHEKEIDEQVVNLLINLRVSMENHFDEEMRSLMNGLPTCWFALAKNAKNQYQYLSTWKEIGSGTTAKVYCGYSVKGWFHFSLWIWVWWIHFMSPWNKNFLNRWKGCYQTHWHCGQANCVEGHRPWKTNNLSHPKGRVPSQRRPML